MYHKGEETQAYRGARDVATLKKFIDETAAELLTEES